MERAPRGRGAPVTSDEGLVLLAAWGEFAVLLLLLAYFLLKGRA
ncbi:hypothetical protein SAMN05660976_05861 [Nonomuraea pusilla]|uniref:Uncharacterized protein n=1 Tax=Nonomuraea pusilla TaxID=46177 RepID=A0A1H8AKZ7_9ACTN|nr:hypothetical protein SAMN05660976_05861 [Nonomuraea pusilla]